MSTAKSIICFFFEHNLPKPNFRTVPLCRNSVSVFYPFPPDSARHITRHMSPVVPRKGNYKIAFLVADWSKAQKTRVSSVTRFGKFNYFW
jgi:hypothetical protein